MAASLGQVQFKVFLKTADAGEVQEIRRFYAERNYNLLREQLCLEFPHSDFSLTWTDSEGRIISINNDEELSIALSEMPGEPYKLTLTTRPRSPPER